MTTTNYTVWKAQVAALLEDACGLSPADLPDVNYPDLFEAGCTPAEAAEQALANADAPDLLFLYIETADTAILCMALDDVPW